jgi:hypothetical protein
VPNNEDVILPFTEILPVTSIEPVNNNDPVISKVSALLENARLPVAPFTAKLPFTESELVISTLPVNMCLFESNVPN